MTQNRVLFVDDEPSILAIYQMLDSFLGDEFKIATASGGEEALGLVEQSTFDVVVSDLTMPKMTGVEFLTEVARRSPASARIVVSGFVDEVSVAKCCMVGHRYFIKPFDPIALTGLIQNLSRTKKPPMSKAVHEIIGKIGALPCPSETFLQLTSALNSPTASIQDISDIVSIDPALTAKVLQIVNSAQFGSARKITSIMEAVQMVGLDLVRAIAGGLQIFDFYGRDGKTRAPLGELWKHSLQVAFVAKGISEMEGLPNRMCSEAFTIGLLHDVGKLILASNTPDEFRHVLERASYECKPSHEIENEIFGSSHAQIGAYLLRLWGLPDTIVTAVESHHSVTRVDYKTFTPFFMVHMAQCITRSPDLLPPWHFQVAEEFGLTEKLEVWRNAVPSIQRAM